MRKGDLVRLKVEVCFTKREGGGREFSLGSSREDSEGAVRSYCPMTPEEKEAWYEKPGNRGFDSAGEPKLPPMSRAVMLHRERTYIVLRARARALLGYGNATPGLTKLLDTVTGETTYVKRDLIEVI